MKEFRFPVYAKLGKFDYCEAYIDAELSNMEAKILKKYGTKAKYYHGEMDKCFWLKKLYKRLYEMAIEALTEEASEMDLIDEKYRNDPNWRINQTYKCGVDFPEEFEEELEYDE